MLEALHSGREQRNHEYKCKERREEREEREHGEERRRIVVVVVVPPVRAHNGDEAQHGEQCEAGGWKTIEGVS